MPGVLFSGNDVIIWGGSCKKEKLAQRRKGAKTRRMTEKERGKIDDFLAPLRLGARIVFATTMPST